MAKPTEGQVMEKPTAAPDAMIKEMPAGGTKLDQRLAHIIRRWVVDGWSADEIAAETPLETGHICFLKHRGLKKIREYCAGA